MFNLAVIPHFLLHYKIINTISSLRSSRPEVFCKKGVLRKFAKFLGKHLCQSLFFNKVAGLPVNSVKFLRTSFFIEHLWWLLLFSVETFSLLLYCFFWMHFLKLSKTFKTFLLWMWILCDKCSEAATRGVLWDKMFLEISQNSQENTCASVSFSITLQTSEVDC